MKIKIRFALATWVFVCFLVPPDIRLGGFSILYIFVFLIIGLSLAKWILNGCVLKRPQKVEKSLLLFALIAIISWTYNSTQPFEEQEAFIRSLGLASDFLFIRLTIFGALALIVIFGGYHLVTKHIRTEEQLIKLTRAFVFYGFLNALITLAYWLYVTGGVFARYNFFPPIENSQGIHLNLMSVTFILALALYNNAGSKQYRQYLIFVMLCVGLSIITVMVRQGWVMFFFSVIIYLYLQERKKRCNNLSQISQKSPWPIFVVIVCVVLLFVFNFQDLILGIFSEIFNPQDTDRDQNSLSMRVTLFVQGVEIFLDNFLIGIGFGHYPAYSTASILVSGKQVQVTSPHNGLVTIAAELGIFGVLALTFITYRLLKESYYVYKNAMSPVTNSICNAIFSILIVISPSQLISNSMIIPLPTELSMVQSSLVLWILFGMVAAVRKNMIHKSV